MLKLTDVAPIIWAKWGGTCLEALRQEALDAADDLAFRAMNSEAGVRALLVVCTTGPARIRVLEEALQLKVAARPVDWKHCSVAEIVFRTEKTGGLRHQEWRDGQGRTALVLCATRPPSVRTIEDLLDLPK